MFMATNASGASLSTRGDDVRWFDLTVSYGEGRAPGTVPVSGPSAFGTERIVELPRPPFFGRPNGEPLVLWVHGYNNTPAEAVYRHAQMAQDIGFGGPQVSFVWPSAASARGYIYDRDSVLDARVPLSETLRLIRSNWSGEVLLVAHSVGSFLSMESLGRLVREGGRAALPGGILLLQPDIDPNVFADQVPYACHTGTVRGFSLLC